jgi:hypothetical protein
MDGKAVVIMVTSRAATNTPAHNAERMVKVCRDVRGFKLGVGLGSIGIDSISMLKIQ